jgi:hypothetical protein
MVNVLLIAVFSYAFSGMLSHWAHIGGAIGGFVACFVLHFLRFGPLPLRAAAVPMLLLLPYLGYAHLRQVQATGKVWQRIEMATFLDNEARPITTVAAETLDTCQKHLNPLLNQHASRRDPKKVEAALAALEERKKAIEEALQRLPERRSADADLKAAREKAGELLRAAAELCDLATAYLRKGEKAKRADEDQVANQFGKVDDLWDEWRKLIETVGDQLRKG